MSGKPVFDEDNPEWTERDFEQAKLPHELLPPEPFRERGVRRRRRKRKRFR